MKNKKVLIVDYNDVHRQLMKNLIGQLYTVESVKSGNLALERVANNKFDLILIAIQMPDLDGISIAKAIWRLSSYQYPIIAVSSYSAESARQCFLEIGFIDLINKPIRPKEFLDKIAGFFTSQIENENGSKDSVSILDKNILHQLSKYKSAKNIRSLYIDFLAEFDQLMEKLEIAFEEKNKKNLIENLHTIKGNSGSLGANVIYTVATKADRLARAEDWDTLENMLEKLRNERVLFEKYLEEETTFNL
ncbi:response regulator [Algoriphagus sp. AGSA1]|uniref:response regulator n=1 Tax=Algoriphagus sp. AGSA1 TaxID=2907213 RepID=UPI001F37AE23|nr:response regulator [Algoriphagus sp. AGSA1]MCE7053530.1 response regulator [Algoriphagus sp. AGSA1]